MALVKCKSCGKPVSDKAPRCPHCGCNLTQPDLPSANVNSCADNREETSPEVISGKKSIMRWFIPIISLLVVCGIIGGYLYHDKQKQLEAEAVRIKYEADSIAAVQREIARLDSIRQDSIARVDSIISLMPLYNDIFEYNKKFNSLDLRDDIATRCLKNGFIKTKSRTHKGVPDTDDADLIIEQYCLNPEDTLTGRFPWCKIDLTRMINYDGTLGSYLSIGLTFSSASLKQTFTDSLIKNDFASKKDPEDYVDESLTVFEYSVWMP